MLSVSKPMLASQAGRYFEKDDYYLAEKGQWLGKGAETLGLEGDVLKEAFNNVALGKDSSGEKTLVHAKGDAHRAGIDLTFSAPKSVSILSLASPSVKTLHDKAVEKTIEYIEKYHSQTRETQDKETKVITTGNLVVAKFDHATSRELDPQLHSHCFVMNMTHKPDGEWRAFHNDLIYKDQKELGRIYRNELANELQKEGYAIEITDRQNSFFEIKGVPGELIESFSQRRQQIEQRVNELRKNNEYRYASDPRLYEIAALGSRAAKVSDITKEDLKNSWDEMIQSKGHSLQGIKEVALKEGSLPKDVTIGEGPIPNKYEYLKIAAKVLTESESVFHKKQVLDIAVKLSLGECSIKDLDSAFNELSKDKAILKLNNHVDSRGNARDTFTTPEMKKIEKGIIKSVNAAKDKWELVADKGEVERFIAEKEKMQGWNYTEGQKQYITTVLTSRDGVNIIQGDAGSGKTAGASVIKEFGESHNLNIRGVGFTGKAAQELQGVGIDSMTISSFLSSNNNLPDEKSILLVDEASMVGSKYGMALLEKMKSSDSKIVIIGDVKQFQSISAGRLLSELQQRTNVDKVEMKEVLRQKTEHMKEVVKALNHPDGMDVKTAFDILDKNGKLVEIEDRESRMRETIKAYLSEIEKGKETLILTETNKDRIELNDKIRNELVNECKLDKGQLHKVLTTASVTPELAVMADSYSARQLVVVTKAINEQLKTGTTGIINDIDKDRNTITFISSNSSKSYWKFEIGLSKHFDKVAIFNEAERNFSPGDRIVFLKNDSGIKVQNGLQGTIRGIDDRGNVSVETRNGFEVKFNIYEKDPIKGDNKNKYNYIDHAYAVTEYKSQGSTVDNSIWFAEKGNSNALYVAATRAKEDFIIFTSDKENLAVHAASPQEKSSTLDYEKDDALSSDQLSENKSLGTDKFVDFLDPKNFENDNAQSPDHPSGPMESKSIDTDRFVPLGSDVGHVDNHESIDSKERVIELEIH